MKGTGIILSDDDTVSRKFLDAAERAKGLEIKDNDIILNIYGLYKQATVGDNFTDMPGMFDLKGRAKWNAWMSKHGMTQEDARLRYIDAISLLP
ncbi:acyl-CoA-binding protein [Streptomyces goshikiensis]|uniref:acyl-CoA-binding protein n=1 Tax=Streptomyces goshikiensis TaxID=1942 RepID=UPI00368FB6F2